MSENEIQAVVKEIAGKLEETDETPVQQIQMIIEMLGAEFAREVAEETLRVEEAGGMMTHNGERRRTKGGVFFYLAKGKMDHQQRIAIFPNFGSGTKGRVIDWQERMDIVPPLFEDKGQVRTMRIILQGRPGKVEIVDNSVITTIEHMHGPTPFPRGVPHPPEQSTVYTVFMAIKQWEEVAEAIQNPKDELVIEGTCMWDPELKTIAVFAQQLETKLQAKAQRRQNQPQDQQRKPQGGQKGGGKFNKGGKPGQGRGQDRGGKPGQSRGQDRGGKPGQNRGYDRGGKPPYERGGDRQQRYESPRPAASAAASTNMPADVARKLSQLQEAANTLRSRITDMESKGQPGVAMTRKLLQNTEKQIEALQSQYAD